MPETRQELRSKLARARYELAESQRRVAELEALLSEDQPTPEALLDTAGYERTFGPLLEGCQIIGVDWRYLYVNDAAARYGRQAKAELLGHTIMDRYPGIENTRMFAVMRRCMKERMAQEEEVEFTYPDGSRAWFEFRIQPAPEGIFILSLDITERKRVEAALRRSEERFRTLIETAPGAILVSDSAGRITLVNGQVEALFGYRRDELIGQPIEQLLPEQLRKTHVAHRDGYLAHPSVRPMGKGRDLAGRRKDGAEFPVEIGLSYTVTDEGIVTLAFVTDITERKRAEEILRRSEERFRFLVEAVEDYAIYLLDASGQVVSWNSGAERLNGYRTDEIIGQPYSRFFTAEDRQVDKPQRLLTVGESQGRIEDEGWRVRKDSSRFWANVVITALRNVGGSLNGYALITRDLTQRKRAEEHIRKLNRTLSVLSDINQAIVRTRRLPALFERACEIAVDKGAFRMAWIGLLDPKTGRIDPVAQTGVAYDYLEKLNVILNDEPGGQHPLAHALRAGARWVCNDLENDPQTLPWREQALRLGYRASAAWPLAVNGQARGLFNLYADEPDFFDDEELKLLDELAMDISFAMEVAEQDEQRREAETAVRRYAQRMEVLHDIDIGLIQGGSIQALVEATLKRVRQLIPCQRAQVSVTDETTGEGVVFAVDLDGQTTFSQGIRAPIPPDVFEGYDARHIRLIDDFRPLQEAEPRAKQLAPEGLVSSLDALLMDREHPIGSLGLLADTPGSFTPEHQEIAAEVANQLAIAIQQLRLSKALARHAAELEQKVAERTAALSAAKERVEAILNNSPDGIMLVHTDLSIQQVNAAFNRLFACEQDDYFGQSLVSVVHADDVDRVTKAVRAAISEQQGQRIEIRTLRKDGKLFEAELSLGYIKEAGLVCTFRDIGERKQQERQLRYYASLQENVSDAVISADLDFRIQSWNKAAERIYGWRAEEVMGQIIAELLQTPYESDQERERIVQGFLKQGHWEREFTQRRKDGSEVHILGSTNLLKDERGVPFGVVALSHDITERKRAEEALNAKVTEEREFQDYLRALHEITIELAQVDQLDEFYRRTVELGLQRLGIERLALFLYDAENNMAHGTYGTDPQGKLVAEHQLRFVPAPNGIMARAFRREERFYIDENVRLLGRQQEILGAGWNAAAILWNGTQSLGWLVADNLLSHKPASKPALDSLALYALSIGALLVRKQAENALREQHEFLQQVINNVPGLIMVKDGAGRFQLVNNHVAEIHSGSPADMLGKTDADFNPNPAEVNFFVQKDRETLETRRPLFIPEETVMGRYYQTTKIPLKNRDGEYDRLLVVASDITERKNAEEALRQALEKEKELNELKSRFVSMASHEFRTPLATILAVTETLSAYRHRMVDAEIEQRLGKIREQVGHLKAIMDDMLQLARLQARRADFNPIRTNLDTLCRSILDEFLSQPDITHRVLYTCDDPLREEKLDNKLMRQIIGNLVSNAIKYSSQDQPIIVSLEYRGEALVLRVRDGGIGIPEADLRHLFEPFHRATNVGTVSGTGLGLVIVKESVELHGGTIAVESQVGVGTTFTVNIPVTTDDGQAHDENPGD